MQINDKIKLCFVISEDWYFISHRFELAKKLLQNQYEINLICNISKHKKIIESSGIKVTELNFKRSTINIFYDLFLLLKLRKIFSENNFNIIHSVGLKPILLTSFASLFKKNTFIINAFAGMGHIFTSKNYKNTFYRIIFIFMMRIISKKSKIFYLAQNQNDQKILIKSFNLKNKKIFLIPGSGIDTFQYSFRFKKNEKNKKILIIMHSRMLIEKGIREFYEASRIIYKKNIDCEFILIGKIDEQNPSALKINELKNWSKNKNFKWLDYQEDIKSRIYEADISCLPSYREGFPKSILEDCSCGTPVICTNIPGCNSIIKNDYNGILVNKKSAFLLSEAIVDLSYNYEKRLLFAERSRKIVEKKFSLNVIYKSMNEMYRKVIQ